MGRGSSKRLERTAYHEAGHVVACYHLKIRFKYVSILRGDGFLGEMLHGENPLKNVDCKMDDSLRFRDRIEREAIVTLAGQAAVDVILKRQGWRGSGSDWLAAVNLASCATGDPEVLPAYMDYLWVRSKSLFAIPWLRVATRAVAKELLKQEKISYRDVMGIIEAAIDTCGKVGRKLRK